MKNLIKTAQKTFGYVYLTAGISLSAFATTYTGTITETVTGTDSPAFHVGQTVLGSYQYECASTDGDFGSPFYAAVNAGAVGTLSGSLFGFFGSNSTDAWLLLKEGSPFTTHLAVSGDEASAFHYDGQKGSADYSFSLTDFNASYIDYAAPSGPTRTTWGSLSFSNPVAVAVPDPVSTAALLAGTFLCGAVVQNRRRALKRA